ncbi:DUF6599 family protein [Granulicella aggregans]|uniref:DUF6599 family protein n=1 Tax=Granulicella aggregans TaxID=474949 RepID=UPI0021E00547|nr:DUF6599 family protein [Granulicella aggregans]
MKIVEPAPPLLPKQFGKWQQAADSGVPPAADDATTRSVLFEDGLSRTANSSYKREGGGETVAINAFQFGDATGAYSAFTLLRTPEFKPLPESKVGATAVQRGDTVLLWSGTSVLMAEFHGGHRVAELSDMVSDLPKIGGTKGLPPLLPTTLPAKGLLPETVKYALGSSGYEAMGGVLPAGIIGFDKSAEVVTAKYAGKGTLTLLLYPTPQIAGAHGRQIEAEMNRQGAAAGTVKLKRDGVLVLLTTGNWQPADAQQLVENTHLNLQVSYDKPMPLEFHAEIRKTATLLTSIAELSAALMLAAVVLGLFFGGGRALIRVLQGKPAATEPEFLRIDLRDRPGDGGRMKPLR